MKNKLDYLNNEKKLYDCILQNPDSEIIATQYELANKLNVSVSTISRWRKKLIEEELITCKIQVINNRKQCVLKIRG